MRAFFDRMMDPSRDDRLEHVAADFVEDDRRAVVGGGISSRDEYVRLWSGQQAAPGFDLTLETVATRGDRLVLYRLTMVDDGVMTEFLQIDRWNDDGLMDRQVRLDPDGLDGAMAELNRLWFEGLNERRQVVARLGRRLGEAWVAPSSHPFDHLLTSDFELVDGRTLGMGALDRAVFEAALRGREADGTTGAPVPSRVQFVSDEVMVFRADDLGHTPESGVDWEEIACNVLVVEGDRIARLEMFDEDPWDDAMARAHHLVGADVPGGPENAASRQAHNAASPPGARRLDR